jgi:hypothetical protein
MKNVIEPSKTDKQIVQIIQTIGKILILIIIVGIFYNICFDNLSKVWPIIDRLQFYSFLIYLNQEFPFNLKVFFRMFNFDYLWKEVLEYVDLGGF